MNIRRTVDLLLQKLSITHKVYYMERRYYVNAKVSKSYIVSIDDENLTFKSLIEILTYLKQRK